MAAIIIGLCFIMIAIIIVVRTKKVDAQRVALMKRVSPNKNPPGVLLYAKISRDVCSVLAFAFGVVCILGGLGVFSS